MSAMKLDYDSRRSEIISACFTREEKERVVQAALAQGIPPAWFVRRVALAEAAKAKVNSS